MKRLVIPELTNEIIELLCCTGKATKKQIFSRVSSKKVQNLNIWIEAEGSKSLNLTVAMNLSLSRKNENCYLKKLANRSTREP